MLPDHEALVFWAEFVPGVEVDGRMWTQAQKAAKIGLHPQAYEGRLKRGRLRIWEWSSKGMIRRRN